MIYCYCCNSIHCLLLLMMSDFIRIEKNIGRHEKSTILMLQFQTISHVHWTQRYMCTFVWKNEWDRWRRTKSIISLFFLSLSLFSREWKKERESLKFSLIYTHTTYCSLAYILAIDSTSSYEISELSSQTSREDDDDDGNDNWKKERERERERDLLDGQ